MMTAVAAKKQSVGSIDLAPTIDAFEQLVSDAEKAGQLAGVVKEVARDTKKYSRTMQTLSPESSEALTAVLGAELAKRLTGAVTTLAAVGEALGGLSGESRTDGRIMAEQLGTVAQWGWLGNAEADRIKGLLTRWENAVPKSTSMVPDLTFKVVVTDTNSGDVVASTRKDNLFSLREQVRKHHKDTYGEALTKDDVRHKALTNAIKDVINGGDNVMGGGYLVTRD